MGGAITESGSLGELQIGASDRWGQYYRAILSILGNLIGRFLWLVVDSFQGTGSTHLESVTLLDRKQKPTDPIYKTH